MELLIALGIPALLLIVATLILANGNPGLRERLFHFEMSGRSSQIWTFGVLLMSTISIIVFFFKR